MHDIVEITIVSMFCMFQQAHYVTTKVVENIVMVACFLSKTRYFHSLAHIVVKVECNLPI
jgi:peroxiredoxin